jgi:nucleotide-binding universal stress UspA family protein
MKAKILCGIDGRDHTARAVTAAVGLAKKLDAELTLYMVNSACLPGRGPIFYLWPDDYVERTLNEAAFRARWSGLAHVRCESDRTLDIADAIVAYADRQEADYIVLGASGRSELIKLISGSVTRGVTAKANCPVLIVRRTRDQRRDDEDRGLPVKDLSHRQHRLAQARA